MKRSSQVSLVLMTVAGIGAGAYALAPGNCRQSEADAVRHDPTQDCRSPRGGSGGGRGSSLFSSTSSGGGATSTTDATSTARGGFGWIGRALSGGG